MVMVEHHRPERNARTERRRSYSDFHRRTTLALSWCLYIPQGQWSNIRSCTTYTALPVWRYCVQEVAVRTGSYHSPLYDYRHTGMEASKHIQNEGAKLKNAEECKINKALLTVLIRRFRQKISTVEIVCWELILFCLF
jgi:hypothetical protein